MNFRVLTHLKLKNKHHYFLNLKLFKIISCLKSFNIFLINILTLSSQNLQFPSIKTVFAVIQGSSIY
jgi:hypothetical protein